MAQTIPGRPLTAITAGEDVVPASELVAAIKQIRELQRLLGKKTMENEILKEAVEVGRAKNGLRMRPCCRGRRLRAVSQALGVSRAQLSVHVHRKPGWRDGRQHRQRDDSALLARIMGALAELSSWLSASLGAVTTSVRGRTTARRQRQAGISRHARSWPAAGKKPAVPLAQQAHKGRVAVNESNRRWCSDGFEFRCDNGENSGSRSPWTAVTGKPWTGPPAPGVTTVTRYKMSCCARSSVASGMRCRPHPVEWLGDGGVKQVAEARDATQVRTDDAGMDRNGRNGME